ncbi:Glycosaminoglycan xylosylkinase [Armadillidium vulgare]|nr:Glycosaminoglycan xylosylkinase [Armadillidium vulgare]
MFNDYLFPLLILITGIVVMKTLNSDWIKSISVPLQNAAKNKLSTDEDHLHSNDSSDFVEIFCLKDCDDVMKDHVNRPGLKRIKMVYKFLPDMRNHHYHNVPLSPYLISYITKWKKILLSGSFSRNPWKILKEVTSFESLFNDLNSHNGLSDIVHAMRTQKVLHADVGFRGTQLKLMLTLEGNQKAIFKPKRSEINGVVKGDIYSGTDRHQGEIVAFHLSILLNITSVPLVVGRKFLLRKQILSVASKQLSKTVFYQGRRTCFYGECHFCRRKTPVCDDGVFIDGALILWLPDNLPLAHIVHPWARTYQKDKLARWEISENYCFEISPSLLSEERIDLLLNLVDTCILDFLIQNGDRHHFTVLENAPRYSFISLDNGKSFGNPFVDHLDVLAPLLQCCRIRQRTFDRLFLLKGGVLSRALDELLSTDPLYPILSVLHSMALDRRVTLVLAAIEACRQSVGNNLFL